MKKVAVIGTVGVPACYGGFESLVDNLLDYTPEEIEYTVYCTSKKYRVKMNKYKNARLKYININANGIIAAFYDFISYIKSLKYDYMLILGYTGCIFLPFIRPIYKGKIITNIDGLEWKREKYNKYIKKIQHYAEGQAVKYSDTIIGDNQAIVDYVKDYYGKEAKLIAYGGDNAIPIKDDLLFEKYPFCKDKYDIAVCRIEPENNVHIILEAYEKMANRRLIFIGNWDNNPYGNQLKNKYLNTYDNIIIVNPIYDNHDINWLRSNASLYIHGHSAGGTNPSLVEAMNLGLPILAYDCIYNRYTTEDKGLYWKNTEDLIGIIGKNNNYESIADNMKSIGMQKYKWCEIAKQYNDLWD